MSALPLRSSYASLAAPRVVPGRIGWGALVTRAVDLLMTWDERTRQRRQLRSLGDSMLRDLGLSPADVEVEVTKPFWRV